MATIEISRGKRMKQIVIHTEVGNIKNKYGKPYKTSQTRHVYIDRKDK